MNKFLSRVALFMPLLSQLSRFGVVGLAAAAIHFAVVVTLVQYFSFAPLIANAFGFVVSFQMSYWGHRMWTFGGTDILHKDAVLKLMIVQALNFCANEALFYIFLMLHLPYQIALLIVLTVLPIFTFISSKLWVFR